jgi:uncharacterized protein YceK
MFKSVQVATLSGCSSVLPIVSAKEQQVGNGMGRYATASEGARHSIRVWWNI